MFALAGKVVSFRAQAATSSQLPSTWKAHLFDVAWKPMPSIANQTSAWKRSLQQTILSVTIHHLNRHFLSACVRVRQQPSWLWGRVLSPGRQELSSSKFLGVPSAITLPNMHWVLGVSGIFFFKYFHRFQMKRFKWRTTFHDPFSQPREAGGTDCT